MRRWVGALALCVLLWRTESVLPQDAGRRIEEVIELRVCVERGERFLQVWRTKTFKGFAHDPVERLLEFKAPWGAAPPPEPPATPP